MNDIVCNTTFFVAENSAEELIDWLRVDYLPSVKRVGFSPRHLLEIADNLEPGKKAFALHLYHPDESAARDWIARFSGDKIGEFAGGDYERCVWINTFMRPRNELFD